MNLNQVTIPATDVARSAAFYRDMGFTLIVDALPRYARFECPEGDATFSLHHVDQPTTGPGMVIYFECADLDERAASLQAKGFVFAQLPTDERWLWREARLLDPAGNEICLFHAGENRKNPPWRVKT
jgi:catechol 2,3-dioxygenase-like lactoylglutathione lyase family enzyme